MTSLSLALLLPQLGFMVKLSVMGGLVMVFVYGVMLGAIRRMSRGMLAPLATHVAADMMIFSIVLWIYFKLQAGV